MDHFADIVLDNAFRSFEEDELTLVSKDIRACDVQHHVVHFHEKDGVLDYRISNLSEDCYRSERKDPVLNQKLKETVTDELLAHFKYMMFADRAKRRGMEKLSNLIYSVYDSPTAFMESVETYVAGEEFEYEYLYKALAKYANEHQYPLAQQAYEGAGAAEKIHAAILKEAANVKTYEGTTVYVCPICGYVMAGDSIPERCPVCGGPERQYEKF